MSVVPASGTSVREAHISFPILGRTPLASSASSALCGQLIEEALPDDDATIHSSLQSGRVAQISAIKAAPCVGVEVVYSLADTVIPKTWTKGASAGASARTSDAGFNYKNGPP